jgi:hypothetical protein
MTSKPNPFIPAHFKAILYRRFIIVKRSWKTIVASVVATVIFSGLAILAFYMMKSMMKSKSVPVTFATLINKNDHLMIEYPLELEQDVQVYVQTIIEMFKRETGFDPSVHLFHSPEELNAWQWNNSRDHTGPDYVSLGIGIHSLRTPACPDCENEFVMYYNSSEERASQVADLTPIRLQWKVLFDKDSDFEFAQVLLLQRRMDVVFGYLAPFLISDGLLSIVPLLIAQPIIDITGEVRPYMISCTLSVLCYWMADFVVDFAIWIIAVTIIWIIFLAAQIVSFIDNAFSVWYSFVFAGPSFIMFVYCTTFLFSSPETASRQAFLAFIILLLVPIIVDVVVEDLPSGVDWVYALLPVLHVQRLLTHILTNIGTFKKPLSYYWKFESSQPYLVMEFVDTVVFAILLWVLETVRVVIARKGARRSFGDYGDFFKAEKAKHPVTDEAKHMEE